MPRPARLSLAGLCCHVINRGNGRATVFRKDADYHAFLRILSLGCERHNMRLLAWCLMPNHFHFVAWPRADGDLQRMMQWVTTCHVRRYHRHNKTSGHVWQGRYKSFPIQGDGSVLRVLRYVERNPVRAGLVKRVQDWEYSSALAWSKLDGGSGSISAAQRKKLAPDPLAPAKGSDPTEPDDFTLAAPPIESWLQRGPAKRPSPWLGYVKVAEAEAELALIRESVNRGAPFGGDRWRGSMADKLGLESTMRPRGRPVKPAKK